MRHVKPILIGRRNVVAWLEQLGLRLRMDDDFELCDPQQDDRYRDYWEYYHTIMRREGVSVNEARRLVRTNNTVIAALMVQRGEADGMLLCGAWAVTRIIWNMCLTSSNCEKMWNVQPP